MEMSGKVEILAGEVSSLNLQGYENHINNMKKGSGAIIICDAWYGFPTQKRPRRERILAVSKQIYNFIQWRRIHHDHVKEKNLTSVSSTTTTTTTVLLIIGKDEDVQAIRQRVQELQRKDDNTGSGEDACDCDGNIECIYLPGKQLEDLAGELLLASDTTGVGGQKEMIAYLSPDASEKLNASEVPPRIVVVGMLVDRKVQPNRSKLRAQSLSRQSIIASTSTITSTSTIASEESSAVIKDAAIRPMQLPLDALNLSDVSTDEPLNIDTVMEMMERWWMNEDSRDGDSDAERKPLFCDAAARALLTHRQRHPNRIIHGGASEYNK